MSMPLHRSLLGLAVFLTLLACPGPDPKEDASVNLRDAGDSMDASGTDATGRDLGAGIDVTVNQDASTTDSATGADSTSADASTAVPYAVSGSISDLSGTLVLQLNGGVELSLTADGAVNFANLVDDGSDYEITVKQGSPGQICDIQPRSGTVSGAAISDIVITCHDLAATGRVSSYWTVSLFAHSDGSLWNWGDNIQAHAGLARGQRSFIAQPAATPAQVHRVATGNFSFAALDDQQRVWTWGINGQGQCGDGSTTERAEPAIVAGLSNVIQIVNGDQSVLALDSSGQVWAWGSNWYGQLGVTSADTCGGVACSLTPQQISGLPNIVAIALGINHSLLLDDSGHVWASGQNGDWQLGLGDGIDRASFEQVLGVDEVGLMQGVVALSAGSRTSLALLGDGRVVKWGAGSRPSLVLDSDGVDFDGVIALANYDHVLALRYDGRLWSWGTNRGGQLGLGDNNTRAHPTQIEGLLNIDGIAAGRNSSFALSADQVWAWGHSDSGRLGTGQGGGYSSRPAAVQGIGGVEQGQAGATVVAGKRGFTMIDATGHLWAAGIALTTGRSERIDYHLLVPVDVPASLTFSHISMDEDHVLAVDNNGEVWAWGHNNYGALGDGTRSNRLKPIKVPGLTGISAVATGRNHSLALGAGGVVYSWGDDHNGSLGRDTTETCGSLNCAKSPGTIAGLSGVKAIAAHEDTSMIIASDDTVWSWGANRYGLLGNGDGSGQSAMTPVQVRNVDDTAPLGNVRLIEIGGGQALAVDGAGKLWGWGLAGANASALPVEIDTTPFSGSITEISVSDHAMVLSGGGIMVWGENAVGQLGQGDTSGSSLPLALLDSSGLAPMTNVISVAAGRKFSSASSESFSVAVTSDGAVWAWGSNSYGQLADGLNNNSSLPHRVLMGEPPLP